MTFRMRWVMVGWWLVLGCLAGSLSAQAQERLEDRVERLEKAFSTSENTFKVFWKNGLRMQTLDKQVEIRIGGRAQLDWNWSQFDSDLRAAFDGGTPEARIFFRRARIFIQA